jgi:hypothetical protein
MRTDGYLPEVKRLGREADYSPPSNAEVKNDGAISPLRHAFYWHGAEISKHRDNLASFTVRRQ